MRSKVLFFTPFLVALFFVFTAQLSKSETLKQKQTVLVSTVCEYEEMRNCRYKYYGMDFEVIPQRMINREKNIWEVWVVGTIVSTWGDGSYIGYAVLNFKR